MLFTAGGIATSRRRHDDRWAPAYSWARASSSPVTRQKARPPPSCAPPRSFDGPDVIAEVSRGLGERGGDPSTNPRGRLAELTAGDRPRLTDATRCWSEDWDQHLGTEWSLGEDDLPFGRPPGSHGADQDGEVLLLARGTTPRRTPDRLVFTREEGAQQ